ncbi:MAG: gliding motility protein GldM [Prevotellaceae bacterium]|jgi:gliding motility-associated protein GldM|nr:gliding motility protein GldM [Prevotellaceae bacterium]
MAGGGGKVNPRQKMINMMYLVLTAMLALNVSAEILDAFAKIEKGLENTIEITNTGNENTMLLFDEAITTMGEKARPWKEKAELTRGKTKDVVNFIRDIKIEVIKAGDGKLSRGIKGSRIVPDSIEAMDDREAVHNVLLGVNNNGKGYELHKKLEEYKKFLLEHVGDNKNLVAILNGLLDFSNVGQKRDWETFTFDEMPLISSVAILSKLQVDILNCESSILDYLKNQIGKESLKISDIQAAVSNPHGVLVKGASGEAEVFLAAIDKDINANAVYGGRSVPLRNGKVTIPLSGNSIGPNTVAGYIEYTDGVGEKQRRKFSFDYTVVEPSIAVSPTKMNVFYLGVENPVDVSVSGVPQKDVKISISNGSISQVGASGSYIVKPAQIGKSSISVSATVNGEIKDMGSREFRVKRIPTPVASLHNVTGKTITKSQLSAIQGVVAKMPDDFEFDLPITVTSFSIMVEQGGFVKEVSSDRPQFSAEQRAMLDKLKTPTRLLIFDVKAKTPDGIRDLPEISYKVQ